MGFDMKIKYTTDLVTTSLVYKKKAGFEDIKKV